VRAAAQAWSERRDGVELRWHDWWSAPRVRAAIDAIDPDASHASWMESFPWTRVGGVEVPEGHKSPPPRAKGEKWSPARFRELIGDGSFGGYYERPDEEMLRLWQIALEETREVLAEGW
jgi:creatinine amidohydrolase